MVKIVTNAEAAEESPPTEEAPIEVNNPVEETVSEDANLEDWSEDEVNELLADDEDSMPSPPEPEPEVEETAKEETTEDVPAPDEPEPEPTVEEPVAEETVEVPETPEVPEEPEDTRTPEMVAEEVKKARESARENLVEQFKMTEEQEEAFAQNPGEFLSSLAADLYLDLYDSMMTGIQGQMPNMVASVMHSQNSVAKAKQAFYNAWPQLAKPEFTATIDRISDTYSANNKGASQDDAIREIGAQAWVALKLPLDELLALTQTTPDAEPEPEAHVQHVPAGTGASRGNVPAPRQLNEFEQLAEEFIEDDR